MFTNPILPGAPDTLDGIARLIQLSLTPIFLLSGIASLLGVFANRLARVADRVDAIAAELAVAGPERVQELIGEQAYQRMRTRTLDVAVVLATIGGILTCSAVLTLFIGALLDASLAFLLVLLFGGSILAAIGAMISFGYEMLLASRGTRRASRDAVAKSLLVPEALRDRWR